MGGALAAAVCKRCSPEQVIVHDRFAAKAEIARLEAEQKKLTGEIDRLEKKLSNEGFVAKAPAAVVEGEKAKLAKYRENLEGVITALAKMK